MFEVRYRARCDRCERWLFPVLAVNDRGEVDRSENAFETPEELLEEGQRQGWWFEHDTPGHESFCRDCQE